MEEAMGCLVTLYCDDSAHRKLIQREIRNGSQFKISQVFEEAFLAEMDREGGGKKRRSFWERFTCCVFCSVDDSSVQGDEGSRPNRRQRLLDKKMEGIRQKVAGYEAQALGNRATRLAEGKSIKVVLVGLRKPVSEWHRK